MTDLPADLTSAACRLYQHILKYHWTGRSLAGPDPGVRLNARIGRFLKSYTSFLPWRDSVSYVQGQKYWIACNWLLADLGLTDVARCQQIAVDCSDYLLDVQQPGGYWEHPNREWKGRIATVEGNYGAMGLLDSYRHTREERMLEGAKRWFDFAVTGIGFWETKGQQAINYFANLGTALVPNVSISALRTFAWLAAETDDPRYLERAPQMIAWLKEVQRENGELPYGVASPDDPSRPDRIHFLCYQYNAFELLNLAEFYELTGDPDVLPIMQNLSRFVARGITPEGACRYSCQRDSPEVSYYTAAAAAALYIATELDLGAYDSLATKAYQRLLSQQRGDGNMSFYSTNNYKLLSDRRSYPRYLSMTLYLMLVPVRKRHSAAPTRLPQNEHAQGAR